MKRTYRLQTQLSVCFIVLLVLTSAILTSALYLNFRDQVLESTRDRLRDDVSIAALQIDGDAHNNLTSPGDEGNSNYLGLRQTLQRIRDAGTDIYYIYTMRLDGNGSIMFLVDAETDPEEIAHLGDIYDDASPMLTNEFATLDQPLVEKDVYTDKWGTWLTAYAPFYTSDGQWAGVVGMDIRADEVEEQEEEFLGLAITIFITTIPLAVAAGWLVSRKLAAPIVSLTKETKRMAKGDLDSNVEEHNVMELNELATAFNSMTQQLKQSLGELQEEVVERKLAEEELREHRDDLEKKVGERTKDLVESNRELESKTSDLANANNELKDFAYIVSHDLKAPLRAVSSLAGWIREDYSDKLDEDGKEQLELLGNRVKRMDSLINGILQYSRIGRIKEKKEVVDLNKLVSGVIDMLDSPETIEIKVVAELPTILCERTRMEQVFQNLIGNAVKYMDSEQGRIEVDCVEHDGKWEFLVKDNGPGIEEKYHEKIFQLFQSLRPRDEVESTGVGLTIVKKVIETNGGSIWVTSGEGKGSSFYFTLPRLHSGEEPGNGGMKGERVEDGATEEETKGGAK